MERIWLNDRDARCGSAPPGRHIVIECVGREVVVVREEKAEVEAGLEEEERRRFRGCSDSAKRFGRAQHGFFSRIGFSLRGRGSGIGLAPDFCGHYPIYVSGSSVLTGRIGKCIFTPYKNTLQSLHGILSFLEFFDF
jgi:hypothetical protein